MNGDGHLDLVATHRVPVQDHALHIWLGTGQGTFNAVPQTWSSPGYAALAAGDINHDGHLDLLAASHFHQLLTFLGDGTGGWSQSPPDAYAIRGEFWNVAVGDVNQDGHVDLALDGQFLACPLPHGPDVYLGDGTGGWTPASNGLKVFQLHSHGIALGDLNHDGFLEAGRRRTNQDYAMLTGMCKVP
jgi:hypothetical protein